MNLIVLLGNLTRDVEARYTSGGKPVSTGNIAVGRKFRDKEGALKSQTLFVDVVAWGSLADNFASFCQKGREVLVRGYLELRTWEHDGKKHRKHQVVAQSIVFLRKPGEKKEARGQENAQSVPEDDGPL